MASLTVEPLISTLAFTDDPSVRYLATIQGYPLLWDDRAQGPWWPEGEPEDVTYEPSGLITVEPRCDVTRLMPGVRDKVMDCGHVVRSGEPIVTWLVTQRDECLTCAGGPLA